MKRLRKAERIGRPVAQARQAQAETKINTLSPEYRTKINTLSPEYCHRNPPEPKMDLASRM